jgi:chromosome segregation ATPase
MDAHRDEPATKGDLDLVKQELTDKIDENSKKIDQVEQRLTAKIDANSAKIDRLTVYAIENRDQMATKDEVNKRFDVVDKRLDAVDKRLDSVDKRLDAVDRRFDVVDERFDELLRGQDEMIGILTRVDDERVATTAWIRRVEGDVETNTGEIKKIKTKLAMDA